MQSNGEVSNDDRATVVALPPTLEDIQAAFDPTVIIESSSNSEDDDYTVNESEDSLLFTDNTDGEANTVRCENEENAAFAQAIEHDERLKRIQAPDPPGKTEQRSEDGEAAFEVDGPQSQSNPESTPRFEGEGNEIQKERVLTILVAVTFLVAIIIWITLSVVRRNFGVPASGDVHPSVGRLSRIGNDLHGQSGQSNFGSSVALSINGRVLAAGASGFNGNLNGNEVGQVFIYTLDQLTRTWQLESQSIQGDGLFGTSIALSGDGTLLVVADRGTGLVQCFKFDGASWVQQNGSINGTVIALSSNGQVIATSSPSSGQGSVTIYKYILQSYNDGYYPSTYGAWQQYGEPIVSANINELFGYSIAINAEGNVVAVGAPKNSDIATFSGKVRIFNFRNETGVWEQMGNDINGDIPMDQLGISVALSADGSVVATGLITDDERGGEVRVYSLSVNTPSQPTSQPTSSPTLQPSTLPSSRPITTSPTSRPTPILTPEPTPLPSSIPTLYPSLYPTPSPTSAPPLGQPTTSPTSQPTSNLPTLPPTSSLLTATSTSQPVSYPISGPSTSQPTTSSRQPLWKPTSEPSTSQTTLAVHGRSTFNPINRPIPRQPTTAASSTTSGPAFSQSGTSSSGQPIVSPSSQPSAAPSSQPSATPSSQPSSSPSSGPSVFPTINPTWSPTSVRITSEPTASPSSSPTPGPSSEPTATPSGQPSTTPSREPTTSPTSRPISLTWTKVGGGATGEHPFSEFGYSISLSNDGTTLAAGAPYDINNGGQYTGLARVFEVTNDVWIQIGSDLIGEQDNDAFGRVVVLSGDGSSLAVAAPNASQNVSYDPQGLPSAGLIQTFRVN